MYQVPGRSITVKHRAPSSSTQTYNHVMYSYRTQVKLSFSVGLTAGPSEVKTEKSVQVLSLLSQAPLIRKKVGFFVSHWFL
jgi:hypothetical protein